MCSKQKGRVHIRLKFMEKGLPDKTGVTRDVNLRMFQLIIMGSATLKIYLNNDYHHSRTLVFPLQNDFIYKVLTFLAILFFVIMI